MEIFVFGSNLAGRHGKGGALTARVHHGAVYGQGEGLQGRSYAIPTKDQNLRILSLKKYHHNVDHLNYVKGKFNPNGQGIAFYIDRFMNFAHSNPDLQFNVTKIGCGLAGYSWEKDIYPIFLQYANKFNNIKFI